MIIVFKNMSRSSLKIHIDTVYEINMSPHEVKLLDLDLTNCQINISLSPNKNSSIKNDVYHIVLNASYSCSGLENNSEIIITREKIRFACDAFYERLFIKAPNATCVPKEIKPLDEEDLKNRFVKYKRKKLFLPEAYVDFFGFPLFLIILGILLLISLGWKVALVYSVLAYFLLVIINVASKKIVKNFFKKHFSFDKDEVLYEYLKQDYISKYYASENREPFLGKKKWLETE